MRLRVHIWVVICIVGNSVLAQQSLHMETLYSVESQNDYLFYDGNYSNQVTERCFSRWNDEEGVFESDYKKETTYDPQGNISKMIIYKWDQRDNVWQSTSMTEFFYENGNQVRFIQSKYDQDLEAWVHDFKLDRIFDGDLEIKSAEWTFDQGSLSWEPIWQDIKLYYPDGSLKTHIGFQGQTDGGVWLKEFKKDYTYPSENQEVIISSNYIKGTAEYLPDWKTTIQVDEELNKKEILHQVWNSTHATWEHTLKEEYLFDENQHPISSTDYWYDRFSASWIPDWKEISTYQKDLKTSNTTYVWDLAVSDWQAESRELKTYNKSDQLKTSIQFTFNDHTLQWDEKKKQEYNYSDGRFQSKVYYTYTNDGWNFENKFIQSYDNSTPVQLLHLTYQNDTWTAVTVMENCLLKTTSTSENVSDQINIYPNPTEGQLQLQLPKKSTVSLYTKEGKLVQSASIEKGSQNINYTGVAPGMYIIHIQNPDMVYNQKIIIK